MHASTCVGTALTAGFMSLNKLGDKHKAVFFTIDIATVDL
jgi:hypothetical protein